MEILKTLLLLSLGGSLLGLFLMLLRRLAGKKLPGAFFYGAWLLVLLRFIVPLHGAMPVGAAPAEKPASTVVSVQKAPAAAPRRKSMFLPFPMLRKTRLLLRKSHRRLRPSARVANYGLD